MSIGEIFSPAADPALPLGPSPGSSRKRLPPFSLRLTPAERARLIEESKGAPLGAYIKAKVLGDKIPVRMRRTGLEVADRTALARGLALLGQAELASSLKEMAEAARSGSLPLTPETEAVLKAAIADIRAVRELLVAALGLKPERAP